MRGSISSFRFVFSDPKNELTCSCSPYTYAKSDRIVFDLRTRWPNSSDFGPKSDDLGRQIFKLKMACSLNSKYYPGQQAAAERPISWMVTQMDSDIASHPTRSRLAAHLPVARLQSAGAGSGLETKRSALGAHPSVDTYSSWTRTAAAVSHIVKYKIPRQVDST